MEQHDGDERLFGEVTAMDGVMAIQLQWSSRWRRDGDERTAVTAMNERRRRRWLAWRWTARRWTARGLGDERLDVEATGMDVVTATRRQWKRDGNGNEWLGDVWRDGECDGGLGDGRLGDGRLGNGRLGDGRREGSAMNDLTPKQRGWTS